MEEYYSFRANTFNVGKKELYFRGGICMELDKKVLWSLSYGMYAIGTHDEAHERPAGCIVNTVVQITSENPVIALSMNKSNYTFEAIRRTGSFTVSILSEQSDPNAIARLGFSSGRDEAKFDNLFAWELFDGMPIVTEQAAGWIAADVIAMHEMETHVVILARVRAAKAGTGTTPMTYKYYHDVIKGKAPKNAPTYQAPEEQKNVWVCSVCGYIYEGDLTKEAEDFTCPVCKQPKFVFRKQ